MLPAPLLVPVPMLPLEPEEPVPMLPLVPLLPLLVPPPEVPLEPLEPLVPMLPLPVVPPLVLPLPLLDEPEPLLPEPMLEPLAPEPMLPEELLPLAPLLRECFLFDFLVDELPDEVGSDCALALLPPLVDALPPVCAWALIAPHSAIATAAPNRPFDNLFVFMSFSSWIWGKNSTISRR